MSILDTDRWIIRCNSFTIASEYAAEQDWSIKEWSWSPAYTINKGLQVFERRV